MIGTNRLILMIGGIMMALIFAICRVPGGSGVHQIGFTPAAPEIGREVNRLPFLLGEAEP